MEGLRRSEWSLRAYCRFGPRFERRTYLSTTLVIQSAAAGRTVESVPPRRVRRVASCLTGPAVETKLSQEAASQLRVEAGRLGWCVWCAVCRCVCVCSFLIMLVVACFNVLSNLLSAQDKEKHSGVVCPGFESCSPSIQSNAMVFF
jgi:hypothetical protein